MGGTMPGESHLGAWLRDGKGATRDRTGQERTWGRKWAGIAGFRAGERGAEYSREVTLGRYQGEGAMRAARAGGRQERIRRRRLESKTGAALWGWPLRLTAMRGGGSLCERSNVEAKASTYPEQNFGARSPSFRGRAHSFERTSSPSSKGRALHRERWRGGLRRRRGRRSWRAHRRRARGV
jgi:hypothetical protein